MDGFQKAEDYIAFVAELFAHLPKESQEAIIDQIKSLLSAK